MGRPSPASASAPRIGLEVRTVAKIAMMGPSKQLPVPPVPAGLMVLAGACRVPIAARSLERPEQRGERDGARIALEQPQLEAQPQSLRSVRVAAMRSRCRVTWTQSEFGGRLSTRILG